MVEGMSMREAARVFGLHRDTVRKMLAYSVPPSYRRQTPPRRPKLEPFTGVIDRILEDDLRRPRKQRHTAKRIFERLRDEYGLDGGYTTVKDYVREHRRQTREMFVPLSHPPGHAQCDFGEALVVIGGVERKAHCFVIDLPHSDGCFVKAYPAETTEAFLDGHVSAFSFLGGVPRSILYDNTRLAVAKILGDGRRQRTRAFTELQSHYLFEDRFGRPGKGNDKGKVEGLVGYVRRNFLVPVQPFESFDALNAYLERRCLERMDRKLRGHMETIGQRMERDLDALLPLPSVAYDACEKQAGRVSSLSLVRYKTNDYSVPVAYGYRDVLVRGYVDEVVISCGSEVIAKHPRSYELDDFVYDPIHYLPLLEKKTGALDQAAPLQGWALPEEFGTLRRLLESRMGRRGKREYVQVLRLLETFSQQEVHAAVKDALRLGAISFDAVKHLLLCRLEGRPPRLDLELYPYLPRVRVSTTSAGDYLTLLSGEGGMNHRSTLLLEHHLKELKLPSFLREYGKMAAQCAAEGVDHPQYLLRLAELELIDRHQRMVERRIRAARFPAVKSLDTFDFPAIPSLNKSLVMELARCEYIQRRENIIAVGNSGTGKTHVALGLGLAACQRGMSVGFTTAAALVHEMMEARDERRLLNLQRQLSRLNLLIIDELGFVPLSTTGAELLFEVFSQRYERGSILVTTNLPFDEWTEVFGSERLTGALLDRLTHHVHILEMNGESYRLKRSRENAAAQAPDESDHPEAVPEAVLTHPPSLLPACLCDTSTEQLARTFTLANDLSGGTLLLRPTGMFCRRP